MQLDNKDTIFIRLYKQGEIYLSSIKVFGSEKGRLSLILDESKVFVSNHIKLS